MDKNSKLTDEELNKVNGGMKIVVIKDMKNLSKILPFLFRIKKKEQPSNKEGRDGQLLKRQWMFEKIKRSQMIEEL